MNISNSTDDKAAQVASTSFAVAFCVSVYDFVDTQYSTEHHIIVFDFCRQWFSLMYRLMPGKEASTVDMH